MGAEKKTRLDKYVAQALEIPRSASREMIAKGRVTVNGQVCKKADTQLEPGADVCAGGQPLRHEEFVYLMLNKPRGYVTTLSDERGRRTAAELVRRGELSPAEGARLLTFCNNAGPAFAIGVAGVSVFGSTRAGAWLYLLHCAAALLTGLLFCQNAAEQSVTGWMVTYFKGSGIITGALAAYTVTVMWGATLVARLLIAFVFPFKQPRKAMVVMGVSCTIFYILLVQARSQGAAIALLFAFAFAMAGMNPTAVASAGRMTSVTSMGIMLPVAASGAILMPWVIGMVAERAGLAAGMMTNIIPCVGLVLFAILVARLPEE